MSTMTRAEPSIARSSLQWGPAGKAFALAVGLRIFYSLVAAVMSPMLFLRAEQIGKTPFTDHLMQRGEHPVLYALFGVWERFDTLWYIQIAEHGYALVKSTVYYPLYPALIRLLSLATGWDLLSALLVTGIATFFFFWGALRLFELHMPAHNAFRAVLLWALFPDGFVFFAGYPESLLLALTVWSLYFASRRGWAVAALLGLFACWTKALGCLTLIPLLYLGWRDRDWRAVPAAGVIVAGAASFHLWLLADHFPPMTQVFEAYWVTTTTMPWDTIGAALRQLAQGADAMLLLNFVTLVVVLAAGFVARVPLEYRLYSVAAFCVIASKHGDQLFLGGARYALVLFAAFPALASRLEKTFDYTAFLLPVLALNLFLLRVFLDWGLVV